MLIYKIPLACSDDQGMSVLIKNCDWIVTQNPSREVLRNCSVRVEGTKIAEIGDLQGDAEYVIDGSRKILLPGLVNTHTHLSMTLMRGFADDMRLQEWLETKIWPLEQKLTGDICYHGALLGCLEMIRTGTTCFMDMYFFLKDVARAIEKAGLRAILSHAMIDLFDSKRSESQRRITQEALDFIKSLQSSRIGFAMGPHAPYTCSEESLLWSKEVAERERVPIHTHIAETRHEQAQFEKEKGMSEVEYLAKIGFLSPRLVAVHSVFLTGKDVELYARNQVKVSHCPVSNMKLAGGGVAPLSEMFAQHVNVSLGTDGAASNNCLDMFDTMKFCALQAKAHYWDPTVLPAQQVLDLATIEGARALGLEKKVGSIEVGKEADLILVDLKSPNLVPIHGRSTVVSDLVYATKGMNVDSTLVQGKPLMINRNLLTLDEDKVMEEASSAALMLTG
jgi:5-methylthioadenosine/S-adenosylhomocysteine deaminase